MTEIRAGTVLPAQRTPVTLYTCEASVIMPAPIRARRFWRLPGAYCVAASARPVGR